MIEVTTHYDQGPDFFDKVGDYLSKIASAVLSVFRRIFMMEDGFNEVEAMWNAQKCQDLAAENRRLKTSVEDLQHRVKVLKKTDNKPGFWEKVVIEGTLFFTFMPFYIMGLPVIIIRDAVYENRA